MELLKRNHCYISKKPYICRMLRIVSHIERLLMVQDFVTVPRLGGFVLQTVPASYRMDSHTFTPMRKEITFNATLKHNDGLLVESYMEKYNVDYSKAYRMLEDDVNEIKSLLANGLTVSLGTIGTYRSGREGQIIFQTGESNPFNTEAYGLASFQLRTLRSLQREEAALPTEETKSRKDIFYIPVNRNILRGVASAAAAIALFLMVSTPVKDVDTKAYTASFIPSEISSTPNNAMHTEILPVNTPQEQESEASVYYVIVSSVNTHTQANQYLAGMNRSVFKRANKLSSGSKVRVYADKFTSRDKADAYMAKLRENPKYADAWVYVNP